MASGTNLSWLLFTSGGKIGIFIRWHSATKIEILSVSFTALLSSADMNSTGKFAFRYAVR